MKNKIKLNFNTHHEELIHSLDSAKTDREKVDALEKIARLFHFVGINFWLANFNRPQTMDYEYLGFVNQEDFFNFMRSIPGGDDEIQIGVEIGMKLVGN